MGDAEGKGSAGCGEEASVCVRDGQSPHGRGCCSHIILFLRLKKEYKPEELTDTGHCAKVVMCINSISACQVHQDLVLPSFRKSW